MRIRVKLTIILLACTLAPLVIVRIVDVRAIGRLSERVSEQTTTAVSRRVERELILTTNGIAEQMGEKLRAVTMIAQSQAELFSGPASTPPGRVRRRQAACRKRLMWFRRASLGEPSSRSSACLNCPSGLDSPSSPVSLSLMGAPQR